MKAVRRQKLVKTAKIQKAVTMKVEGDWRRQPSTPRQTTRAERALLKHNAVSDCGPFNFGSPQIARSG